MRGGNSLGRGRSKEPRSEYITSGGISLVPRSSQYSSSTSSKSTSADPRPLTPPEQSYFDNFYGFAPAPDAGFAEQFSRLAITQGWSKKHKKQRRQEAIKEELKNLLGTDTSKLEKWQKLCEYVGIGDAPRSITQCKKALGSRKVMVNLINLIDHIKTGVPLIKFKNFDHFCTYTLQPANMIPRAWAKEEGFVKALLRCVT
ncbi:hypothetical protein P280DRAFT_509788 [Massarina eburnea CBS 473.64]|uniref:Uncharacterized protein n=1 Tax=Massarina eburnea CBS 473.64 TaxID=1395130 RepID=A0A6A6RQF5_9PLEO|nr:hypothetical protein P280DRAFT_509788 [Massarina eburnea CBS 473.64]